ncbi:MAG: fatty acid desaturase [Cyanobacteria bacterium]|nr:fatty acid desaturase [Cyanobacteriota bacterium]MDA1246408.1 fatty acid desaturase [Cyanobacteriota bacterium]
MGSLIGLLSWDLSAIPQAGPLIWLALFFGVVGRTLLQTGLFIVGHDSMHGVLWPDWPYGNALLGRIALGLYAALPYRACCRNHQHHHLFTASATDPDFHGDLASGAVGWYVRFMAGYLTWGQMARLLAGWALLAFLACSMNPIGWINVLLFCTLPLLLSSLQLFVFGTYLPHRDQRLPMLRKHADSLELAPWLSLLACFHFGYHREHHDVPTLAWFELPAERRKSRSGVSAGLKFQMTESV